MDCRSDAAALDCDRGGSSTAADVGRSDAQPDVSAAGSKLLGGDSSLALGVVSQPDLSVEGSMVLDLCELREAVGNEG